MGDRGLEQSHCVKWQRVMTSGQCNDAARLPLGINLRNKFPFFQIPWGYDCWQSLNAVIRESEVKTTLARTGEDGEGSGIKEGARDSVMIHDVTTLFC